MLLLVLFVVHSGYCDGWFCYACRAVVVGFVSVCCPLEACHLEVIHFLSPYLAFFIIMSNEYLGCFRPSAPSLCSTSVAIA